MRKFDYRAPRFPVDLSVRVTLNANTCVGRCTEISAEGMRVTTREPLSVDFIGSVQVTYKSITLAVPVRVVHCGTGCDGLQFLCESDEQREDVARFVELLTAKPNPTGPVLLR
jgi:PilZ domain